MATKYVDHGAYGSAAFTASISTNTMTVTAVTSGTICLGAIVASASITSPVCYISAFVSGTNGGVGVYTLTNGNTIASAACTSMAGNPLLVPLTWTLPQDGDGSASTVASTSAIASIAFSGIPTSGVISIMGTTVSTTGVLNAASADAAANALATNINATTTAVVTYPSVWTQNKLQDILYARGPSTGAAAGTCEIMTRAGTAAYNSGSTYGIAYTLNNVSSGASPLLFTGGVGGCWGLINNSALAGFPSSMAALSYGLYTSSAATKYLAGTVVAGDLVNIRPRTVTFTGTGGTTIYFGVSGTSSNFITYKIDDTTIWGDSDNKELLFLCGTNGSANYIYPNYVNFYSSKNSNGTAKLRVANTTLGSTCVVALSAYLYLDDIYMGSYVSAASPDYVLSINQYTPAGFVSIKEIKIVKSINTYFLNHCNGQSAALYKVDIQKLTLGANSSSSPNTGVITSSTGAGSSVNINISSLIC